MDVQPLCVIVTPTLFLGVPFLLSELGKGLSASVWKLVSWADDHHAEIRKARQQYDEETKA